MKGWLLVYVACSVFVSLFYAAGLAGRFFDYHWAAIAAFSFVLAVPLMLAVLKVSSAPAWNIASLWVGAGSISLTVLVGVLNVDSERLREVAPTVVLIVVSSIACAVWTVYFVRSKRVADASTNSS